MRSRDFRVVDVVVEGRMELRISWKLGLRVSGLGSCEAIAYDLLGYPEYLGNFLYG